MPIVVPDFRRGETSFAQSVPSTRDDVLSEQFAITFEENPIMAVRRSLELSEDYRTGRKLERADAEDQLERAGLTGELDVSAGVTQAALDTLMWRKRMELRRRDVFARAQGGFAEGAQRLGLSLATSLADPIGAGLNFVPVVGQARYANWLAKAGSLGGRIGVRARAGAVEGVAGAAIAEVPVQIMRRQEQADYDMTNSLLNVTFGGVLGAGLHTSVGTAGEALARLQRQSRIPRAENLDRADRAIESRLAARIDRDLDGSISEYGALADARAGKVLNTDTARELSPEYRADRTRSEAVHEPSSYLVKEMYRRKLADAPKDGEDALVIFSAGGTGAGKSTGLSVLERADPKAARAQIIYDTNLNNLKSAVAKIDQALDAGKEVRIVYTWRDPIESLTQGALPRAKRMGRTVPIEEHTSTHVGSAQTIKELAQRYAADKRVQIQVIDNSHGKGKARIGEIASIPALEYNVVRGNLIQALDAEYRAGNVSEAAYRGTRGQAPDSAGNRGRNRGSPEPRDREVLESLTAAERTAVASPQVQHAALRSAVGQAVEGRPIDVDAILRAPDADARTLSASLKDAADRQQARSDAEVHQTATEHADEVLARETDDPLKAAEEEAQLAEADAKAIAKALDVDQAKDADITAVREGAELAERWARVAELATVCLVRGG